MYVNGRQLGLVGGGGGAADDEMLQQMRDAVEARSAGPTTMRVLVVVGWGGGEGGRGRPWPLTMELMTACDNSNAAAGEGR